MEDNKTSAHDERTVPICRDCGMLAYHCHGMQANCECENPDIVQVPIRTAFEI